MKGMWKKKNGNADNEGYSNVMCETIGQSKEEKGVENEVHESC